MADNLASTAYCTFHFLLPDYDNEPRIRLSLAGSRYDTRTWLALANYANHTWDWYSVDDTDEVSLVSLAPYFDAGGNLYVVVAVSGESEVDLAWVVIGGNMPPSAILLSGPDSGPAPLEVLFYPIADHADPDGCLVYYEWDFQGDGVYDVAGADIWYVNYTYETPGEYHPVLRVTDNDGATAIDTQTITVTAPEA